MEDNFTPPTDALELIQHQFDRMAAGLGAVHRAWNHAVGPQLAAVTMPVAVKGTELRVNCASPAWAAEILHRQEELLELLQPHLPQSVSLERIRPTSGRVAWAREAAPAPEAPAHTPPSPEEIADVRSTLGTQVADPALEAAMLRAIAASRKARSDAP